MINNRSIAKISLVLLLVLCISVYVFTVFAQGISFQDYEKIKDAFENAKDALEETYTDFGILKGERDEVKGMYDVNAEEIRDQGIEAAHQGVSLPFIVGLGPLAPAAAITELRQSITNAHLTALDLVDGIRLAKALDIAIDKTSKLRDKLGNPENGSQQATGLYKARDDAYKAYVKAYQQYYGSGSATLDKGRNTAPIDNTEFSYGCFGNDKCSDTFSSPQSAMEAHFVACEVKPHQEENFGWYSCRHSSCPKSDEHWVLCKGGCGEMGKKQYGKIYKNGGISYSGTKKGLHNEIFGEADIITIYSHIEKCNVPSTQPHWLNGTVTIPCPIYYYKCNSSNTCPNAENHIDDNENNEQAQNPSTPSTPTTPTMHACGVHASTVSGDHSWIIPPCGDDTHGMYACQVTSDHSTRIASCSATNSYGDYCTVSNYFACQNHAHQFPTRVACQRSACDDMVLVRNEHRISCINGHKYWSCNSSAVEYHGTRTCSRRKVVRQVWVARRGRYEARWGTCGESWAMCKQRSCKDIYGDVGKHQ